jgi:hypothetical protein
MLILTLLQQPQMLFAILRATPNWVWALLAGLLWLGFAQTRHREASLVRVSLMPVVMTAFGIWGMTSAFGASSMFGYAMMMWMLAAAVSFAVVGTTRAPGGTEYHPQTRTFFLPGSWAPLMLILAIFLVRYIVNVDVRIQPALAGDGQYTLVVAAIYGLTSGIFVGRAARLWRLAAERAGSPVLQ